MQEVKTFRQSELVLKVSNIYDTTKLDINAWMPFLNRLCGDRPYQREAIQTAIVYLASGNYNSLSSLLEQNYSLNPCLRDKYSSIDEFAQAAQLRTKLYATIDLATGTGKSYVPNEC